MTQDEIIEMAKQAGCPRENAFVNFDILEEFAKLVAAKEREACAKVCEKDDSMRWSGAADAIRARALADRGEA